MQRANKDLPAVNDAITLTNRSDRTAEVGFQYISGAGTVVVEGSNDNVNWFAILLTSMTTAATTAASFTAAGGWRGACPFEYVRARKSVGTASCVVSLALGLY